MHRTITLQEYGVSEPFRLHAQAVDQLRSAAGGMIDVEAADSGRIVLRAKSHIGTVVTESLKLIVMPKAGMDNVFHLLDRAGVLPRLDRSPFGYDTADLNAAFVTFFIAAVDEATQRGLHRWYRPEEDRLATIRGRIEFAAQMSRGGVATPVDCRFEEYTADVLHNRALKLAATRLLRLRSTPDEQRRRLRHQLGRFEEVSASPVDPSAIARLRSTRLDQHYEPALRLAALVLSDEGLLLAEGDRSASCFSINMNTVFEKYVENALRRLLGPEIQVEGQHAGRLGDSDDSTTHVTITPDLLFKRDGRPIYVGDAKYKLSDTATARSNDWYQLLAYTQGLQLPEGVLIYFDHGSEPVPNRVSVDYSNATLWTKTIRLAGSPGDIDESMADVATWIRARCDHVSPSRKVLPA